jgi:tRNA(adenine34) deaminase
LARFLAEARRMKSAAVAAGDQPYGAVLVQSGEIRGWGPSRVVLERNENAHAERVAIREAQKSLGRSDLSGSILVSTSRPCAACEAAAAAAGVSRMIFGDGVDGGRPRRLTG